MTDPTPAEALKAGEYLPCPFCGGEADVIEGAEWFYVTCLGEQCFCCLGEGYDRDACPDHIFATEAEAIAAWNTRPAADAGEVRTYREGVEREAKAIWMALEGRFLADEWQDAVWAGTSKSTILNLPEEDILAEDGSVYDSPVKKFGRASYMAAAAAIRKLGS